VHVLLATDADWVVDDVVAALGGPDTSFTVCRDGHAVADIVEERTPDLVVLDLQIGTMGGIAVTMALRLDESAGTLPPVNILVLLDRTADVHLARRSGADGWLVKPLDALRLRRAALAVADGLQHHDGVTITPVGDDTGDDTEDDTEDDTVTDGGAATFSASADVEPAPAG
jgi:DNA-binding response OmpR family regulator